MKSSKMYLSAKLFQGLVFSSLVLSSTAYSQAVKLNNLEYPELLVTPLASERLKQETKKERTSQRNNYLPIQVSALSTLVAGIQADGDIDPTKSTSDKDTNSTASLVGVVTGSAWLGLTTYYAFFHRPYYRLYREVKKLPANTKRERLIKERMAEEALQERARFEKRLRYLSVATNLASALFIAGNGEDDAELYGGAAALLSLAPLFFQSRAEYVYGQHKSYKKRIYGPVASLQPVRRGNGHEWVPTLTMRIDF